MKKKNSFFMFIASMIPGAGQMYQGYMKRGVSIMLSFMMVAAFSIFTNIGEIALILPVIWFYAFFDAENKSHLTVDELNAIEDRPIINIKELNRFNEFISSKGAVIFGSVIIFIGIMMFYRTIIIPIVDMFIPEAYYIFMKFPAFIIGVIIVMIGVSIIRGPKKEAKTKENKE